MRVVPWSNVWKYIKKTVIRLLHCDYISFYKEWMDSRVSDDPCSAPTEMGWGTGGRMQFKFLKKVGLKPYNSFLDLGSGTLSLGQFLIPYLDSNKYVGMDISEDAILAGIELVGSVVDKKYPRYIINKDLVFSNLDGEEFDYIWSFSVFNHLPFRYFCELVENMKKIMHKDTRVLLTVWFTKKTGPLGRFPQSSFGYAVDDILDVLSKFGYYYEVVDNMGCWEDYVHSLEIIEIKRIKK